MSNQQTSAWQTATGRQRNSGSRTPQTRSGTASPNSSIPSHPIPTQERAWSHAPAGNVWSQRSNSKTGQVKNSETVTGQVSDHQPLNGFKADEVESFLSRDLVRGGVAAYKPVEAPGGQKTSGAAWAIKPGNMANNQPFFTQLAKQIAVIEGGG